MNAVFFIAAAVALASTILVIVQRNAVHALLYLIISLFAVAVIFLVLGAPFAAALEVIIYAGAIMVLFVFAVMLVGAGTASVPRTAWIGPALLGAVLLAEIAYVLVYGGHAGALVSAPAQDVSPKQVGTSLIGSYLLGVEVAAFILLAGLIGTYRLGRREEKGQR